jgi:hypothetical protein
MLPLLESLLPGRTDTNIVSTQDEDCLPLGGHNQSPDPIGKLSIETEPIFQDNHVNCCSYQGSRARFS